VIIVSDKDYVIVSFCSFACAQDKSKTYERIKMKFSGYKFILDIEIIKCWDPPPLERGFAKGQVDDLAAEEATRTRQTYVKGFTGSNQLLPTRRRGP